MAAMSGEDPRQIEAEPEYDPAAGRNVVAFHAEVYPGNVENLVDMVREADDNEDVFLVWRMSPKKAREIARKLLEVADVCEQIGAVPLARKVECVS